VNVNVSLARSCRGHDMGCLCNRLHRIRPLAVAGDCTTTCAARGLPTIDIPRPSTAITDAPPTGVGYKTLTRLSPGRRCTQKGPRWLCYSTSVMPCTYPGHASGPSCRCHPRRCRALDHTPQRGVQEAATHSGHAKGTNPALCTQVQAGLLCTRRTMTASTRRGTAQSGTP
jgi:hypothetical protein